MGFNVMLAGFKLASSLSHGRGTYAVRQPGAAYGAAPRNRRCSANRPRIVVLFGIYGFFYNPLLVVIAAFVWMRGVCLHRWG
jgi:hypothetical protein